jgi:hypothetical protein
MIPAEWEGDRPQHHGVLQIKCPQCDQTIEVGLHQTFIITEPTKMSPSGTHYGHPVSFVAEAPHLHAAFWGHMVREHQPNPHPYMSG